MWTSGMWTSMSHPLSRYPLVNIQKTMENYNFLWLNPLFLWPFSTAFSMFTRGYTMRFYAFLFVWESKEPWEKCAKPTESAVREVNQRIHSDVDGSGGWLLFVNQTSCSPIPSNKIYVYNPILNIILIAIPSNPNIKHSHSMLPNMLFHLLHAPWFLGEIL
jgi:hypothetical protein